MVLRWRPMQQRDVRECVRIIGAHPVVGPRYGRGINALERAWLRVFGSDAMTHAVFEDVDRTQTQTWGFGVAVFVSDDFIREIKAPPLVWIGPELVNRVLGGRTPILSNGEVREANSADGLNLLVWESLVGSAFPYRPEFSHVMINAYVDLHRGFHLKEMISPQVESVERLGHQMDSGGWIWEPKKGGYVKSVEESFLDFISKPHIIGLTRDLIVERPASWVSTMFDYQPARFRFTESEQRLLHAALASKSGTDQELAKALGVSLPTVKKTWLSIYDRVADCEPALIQRDRQERGDTSQRGKEKRRRLLGYLREHREELRPTARK